jgi:DMSO/TMAO reductase YedYZ molybdopterin-dependent catalytic subunit
VSTTTTSRFRRGFGWGTAGVVTGLAGLAASLLAASLMGVRVNPVVGVAESVIRLTPGALAEKAISIVGTLDKPLLVTGVVVVLVAVFWYAGRSAAVSNSRPLVVFVVLAAIGGVAVLTRPHARPTDIVPVVVGGLVWLVLLPWLVKPLAEAGAEATEAGEQADNNGSRRTFLFQAGGVLAGAAAVGLASRFVGRGRRQVEETRKLLRLPVTLRPTPAGAEVGLEKMPSWRTSNGSFYLIHTAVVVPAIDPKKWRLRIHGLVDRELTLTYQDLLDRQLTEMWMTLNCVSNPVGGDLIGNAWWSGIRIADLLAEAGVQEGADAVKQTSEDGWTCGTPIEALTDTRGAMLAIGMNGVPLPLEHGFPVRMIVPGLYGFVSATKWLVDLQVTKFEDFSAYWTDRGWSEQAPVKLASRIDVPGDGDSVPAGNVRVGGSAWRQYVGVEAVEISLDGGEWTPTALGAVPSNDTWVQWAGSVNVEAGKHELRVRARDKHGETQTGTVRDVVPDGATGWHTIEFNAE